MKKRIISLLLCVVMLIGLMPTSTLASSSIHYPDYESVSWETWTDGQTNYTYRYTVYQESGQTDSLYAELTEVTLDTTATDISWTIPEYLPYTPENGAKQQVPLRVISNALHNDSCISVSIPASVEIIGKGAFKNAGELAAVTFQAGSKLKTIGDEAFCNCALTAVVIPDSVQTIGYRAFYEQGYADEIGWNSTWVDTLTSLTLGSGVQTIGDEAFGRNRILNGTLALPNSLTDIGKNAFVECGFSSITWPDNPDFHEVKGFSYCKNLTGDVMKNLPDSVNSICCEAFEGCTGITNLTIPTFIQTIGESAFASCTALADLTIQNGVRTIGYGAFEECTGLLGKSIEIPVSVQTIYSGAFAGIYDAEAPDAKTLTVSILNPSVQFPSSIIGESGNNYGYDYYNAGETSFNPDTVVKSSADPFAQCAKLLLRAPEGSAVQAYAAAKDSTIFKLGFNLDFYARSVAFQKLEASTDPVYHTVTTQQEEGVTFTVKQDGETLGSGEVVTVQAISGKDVVVIACKEGYYNQVLVITGAEFITDKKIILDPEAWKPLPVSGRLLVNITRDGLPLGSFDGLTLSLNNGDVSIEDVSYPYLVLNKNENIDPAEELTLTVTPDTSMKLTGGTATSTLQNGSFTMELKSWGKAAVTATGTSAAPCVVILFDDMNNAVSSGTTSGGVFTSDALPNGTYKAVAYETNDYFGAVGTFGALDALGLTENDYASGSVDIEDGKTTPLALTVPGLNTENLTSVLDTGKCSLVFRSNQAVTGETFNMQVNYGLKTDTSGEKQITFTLPSGANIQSVYNEQGRLLSNDNNPVKVDSSSGTLYVSLKCDETGLKSFGASITTGGKTLPLGSSSVTVQNIFLNTVESYAANQDGNRLEVYTTPETEVSVTVSGGSITNTEEKLKTNAAGRLILNYSLPDNAAYGQSYTITVRANDGSDKNTITYFPAGARLKQLGFHHRRSDITVIDNDDPDKEENYYTYYAFGDEESKYFTFSATFEADQSLNVTVIVTMQDGSVRSVPMTLIDKTDGIQQYAGELYVGGNSEDHVFHADSIPVGFEIEWDEPYAPAPGDNVLYEQALDEAIERQQSREAVWEDVELDPTDPTLTSDNLTDILNKSYQEAGVNTADFKDNIQAAVDLFKRSFGGSYSFSFFGYNYRMTDKELFQSSIMSEAEYNNMIAQIDAIEGETTQTKNDLKAIVAGIYNHGADRLANALRTEAMIDDIAGQLTEGLGLEKPLQEYQNWDEILAEKGVTYGECAYSAEELTSMGYTRLETENGNCWVKDNGTEKNYVWPDGLDTGSSTFNARGNSNGNDNVNGVMMTLDSAWQTVSGNYGDWQRSTAANGLGYIGDTLQAEAEYSIKVIKESRETLLFKYSHSKWAALRNQSLRYLDAEEACLQTSLKNAVSIKNGGRILSVYNVYNDGTQMNQNIVDTADMDAQLSELEPLMQYAKMHDNWKCWDALFAEKQAYNELTSEMHQKTRHLGLNVVVGSLFTLADVFSYGQASKANIAYDVASGVAMGTRDFRIAQLKKQIDKLHAERMSICGDDWRKTPKRSLTPILDPSGIVYEAVESNVLSGVTATIYEVTNGKTKWNAEQFNQSNDLITDTDGYYAWDVPSGKWQVEFNKTGYKTAATGQLTVPPPQMNLKTAMISTEYPEVISAAAYPDYVELVFSQYMSPDQPTVSGYTCEWVEPTPVRAGSDICYSRVLHLIPASEAVLGETVSVTLSGAKNYAGKELYNGTAYYSGPLTVAVEPDSLKLNYETQIAVLVGEAKDPRVTVQVLDSSGHPISGMTVTAAIADNAYATVTTEKGSTDEDGIAVFSVHGRLPGLTEATFAVEGSSITKTIPVRVTIDSNQAAKPVATIGGNVYTESTNSITVSRGSALTLTCATEDADIYYTTNDTCPCQAPDRQLYTGPITVNEDTYFRIAAYKDGMDYSERLNLKVSVSKSGDSGAASEYPATVEQPENGSVTISPKSAAKGDIVTVTVTPDQGYKLDKLTVTDRNGNELKLTEKNGKYTFTMPASKVTVKATFIEDNSMLNFFVDVSADAYYYDAVLWAAKNGITGGTTDTTFSPDADCTRAQIVTFLWRAAGSPEPKGTRSFGDVPAGSYYEKAVAWATENGITEGTGNGKFSPGAACTRAQAVTFLYRARNASAVSSGAAFRDVAADAYYADAVAWAVKHEITDGIGGGLFAPGSNCTRAQIVTFLYRACHNK